MKNKKLKLTLEQLLTNLTYGVDYTDDEFIGILKFIVSNDKNGKRSIKNGIAAGESRLKLLQRLDKRRRSVTSLKLAKFYEDDTVQTSPSVGIMQGAIATSVNSDSQPSQPSQPIQVVEKEIVRDILNGHLLNFLNEVISSGENECTEFAELSDYHSGEKEWINNIWDEEISKKKRKFLLGKAQQLKDVIETFQIRVHDLSFKFLLHLTSK